MQPNQTRQLRMRGLPWAVLPPSCPKHATPLTETTDSTVTAAMHSEGDSGASTAMHSEGGRLRPFSALLWPRGADTTMSNLQKFFTNSAATSNSYIFGRTDTSWADS